MVQLIKPQQVKIQTTQGEVTVSIILELNINLNADGININTKTTATEAPQEVERKDNPEWEIPDFGSTKIKFGKYEDKNTT
jgi:hypothetical protein